MLEDVIIARNKQIGGLLKVNLYREQIYMKALQTYGEEAQITMVFEEMAELQKVLCKYLRNRLKFPISVEVTSHVAEEIADVEIMIGQMKLLFEIQETVEKFKTIKIDRLKNRLE